MRLASPEFLERDSDMGWKCRSGIRSGERTKKRMRTAGKQSYEPIKS